MRGDEQKQSKHKQASSVLDGWMDPCGCYWGRCGDHEAVSRPRVNSSGRAYIVGCSLVETEATKRMCSSESSRRPKEKSSANSDQRQCIHAILLFLQRMLSGNTSCNGRKDAKEMLRNAIHAFHPPRPLHCRHARTLFAFGHRSPAAHSQQQFNPQGRNGCKIGPTERDKRVLCASAVAGGSSKATRRIDLTSSRARVASVPLLWPRGGENKKAWPLGIHFAVAAVQAVSRGFTKQQCNAEVLVQWKVVKTDCLSKFCSVRPHRFVPQHCATPIARHCTLPRCSRMHVSRRVAETNTCAAPSGGRASRLCWSRAIVDGHRECMGT